MSSTHNSSDLFCDLIFDFNLTQYVTQPTHSGGNILDLILAPPAVPICEVLVYPLQPLCSDHYMISFQIMGETPKYGLKSTPTIVPDYGKIDFEGLNDYLLNKDFDLL